jgi:hypothetical protein
MIRICGFVTIVAGVLILILGILPSLLLPSNQPMLEWILDDQWAIISALAFILSLLLPLVLIALYAVEVKETGQMGFWGFVLAFFGALLFVAFQFDLAFVWPILALQASNLMDFNGPMFGHRMFSFVHTLMSPLYTVGILVFGIAIFRARVFQRWSIVLFMLGMILTSGILFPPLILRLVGALPAALALGAMGLTLWNRKDWAPGTT